MTPNDTVKNLPSHDEIATVAYELWDQAGRPQGHDWEYWLRAEQQLLAVHKQEDRALRHWEKSRGINLKKQRRLAA